MGGGLVLPLVIWVFSLQKQCCERSHYSKCILGVFWFASSFKRILISNSLPLKFLFEDSSGLKVWRNKSWGLPKFETVSFQVFKTLPLPANLIARRGSENFPWDIASSTFHLAQPAIQYIEQKYRRNWAIPRRPVKVCKILAGANGYRDQSFLVIHSECCKM